MTDSPVASPPGTWRAIGLVTRLSLRRWSNRVLAGGWRLPSSSQQRPQAEGPRREVPGKRRPGMAVLAAVGSSFGVVQVILVTTGVVHRLSGGDPLDFWPQPNSWPGTPEVTRAVGALAALAVVGILAAALGSIEARQLEEDLSWLYQTPARATAVLGAKTLEFCLLRPGSWIVGAPMLFAVARMHGLGWQAYPMGAWAAVQIGAFIGSVELVFPLALGRALGPSRVRAAQAIAGIVGAVTITGGMILAQRSPVVLARFPSWLSLMPGGCLLRVLDGDAAGASVGAILGLAWIALPPVAATLIGSWLVRRGLLRSTGETPPPGARTKRLPTHAPIQAPAPRVAGFFAKDLRWVFRDRRAFAQTFLAPCMLMTLQFALNPGFATGLAQHPRWTVAAGFAVAAYGFLFSAAALLAAEGPALWLLYSFPRPIHRMLIDKVALWCIVGMAYLAVLTAIGVAFGMRGRDTLLDLPMAAAGVVVFAFIASGIGGLGADPFAPVRRTVGVTTANLYLGLVGFLTYTLATGSVLARVIALGFLALLALALWQKLRDRIPYLLDPTERPPAIIDLSDAILVVVAFFLAQVLVGLVLLPVDLDPIVLACMAFAAAGAGVVGGALWTFRRLGVRDVLGATALRRPDRKGRASLSLVLAPIAGAALGAGAVVYRQALERAGFFADALREGAGAVPVGDARWL
ncbi:MAG TPA: hypothetical protein VH044_20595, partial [Polyangiaceae bacterium]|nr:hypothetical protein [Polyangiaceae bacterium]